MTWFLVACGAIVLTSVGVLAVHRLLPHHERQSYDEINGYFFASAGVLYAVLLAFVVVAVWEGFDATKQNTYAEANAIPGLYYSATAFPADIRAVLQKATGDYARDVIDDEWALLATGRSSGKVDADASLLRKEVLRAQPVTPQQQALYSTMIDRINTINTARRQRINEAEPAIPGTFWLALIGGATLVILFALFFGVPKLLPHLLMVSVLVTLLAGSLYLAYLMEQPFRGPMRLAPTAFELALLQMGQLSGK